MKQPYDTTRNPKPVSNAISEHMDKKIGRALIMEVAFCNDKLDFILLSQGKLYYDYHRCIEPNRNRACIANIITRNQISRAFHFAVFDNYQKCTPTQGNCYLPQLLTQLKIL
jgi:hypothetical protein